MSAPYYAEVYGTDIHKQKFAYMLNNSEFSDIVFVIDHHHTKRKFYAHKAILASWSDYFKKVSILGGFLVLTVLSKMFLSGLKESKVGEIELQEVDADGFMAFLKYIYTGNHNCSNKPQLVSK